MVEVERPRRHRIRNYLIGLVSTILVVVIGIGVFLWIDVEEAERETAARQEKLAPFYRLPAGWRDQPVGALLRVEQLTDAPRGSRGWRILYRTERSDGSPAVSSGLVFAPKGAAPAGGRPVVAWAHGTVGMGDACAPSRTPDPPGTVPGLAFFLSAGWVVTATDYAGLGTPGIEEYLVGQAAARDVLNSVRAARNLADAGAGSRVALWGHSQGGHSVLWTKALAPTLAPELTIVGTAAAAPAAELPTLVSTSWNNIGGSLIGSEVLVAWPKSYPNLDVDAVWSPDNGNYRNIAYKCIIAGLIDVKLRSLFGESPLFRKDPIGVPSWRDVAVANIPPLPTTGPVLLVQGLADPLVLPGTNAAFVQAACAGGATLVADFIGDLGHLTAGIAGAPLAFTFFQQRFAGIPAGSTCGTHLPVAVTPPPKGT
jgi:pimeloyl-ACP methyl ester carboxylesterase